VAYIRPDWRQMDDMSTVGSAPVLVISNIQPRSRLTTLFRLILSIPWFIVQILWGIIAILAVIVAWFALLFTGRYPPGLYQFSWVPRLSPIAG
jgi:hypothetical protein